MSNYFDKFRFKPRAHQYITIKHFIDNKRTHCWNGTGTGKTACALWAYDILRRKGSIQKLLIVTTKSTMVNTWGQHVFEMLPFLKTEILDGTKATRVKKLKSSPDIVIINHDGIKVCGQEIEHWKPDMVIIDESTAFKKKSTQRWKSMKAITDLSERVIPMSGTPFAQAPTDAWAVALFVCPDSVGRAFYRFRFLTMYQINKFKWLPKEDVDEILFKYIKPVIRIKREDCLELPPVQYIDLDVELSSEQSRVFNTLKKEAIADIEKGLVTAAHEGVLRSKLLQCCSGYVYGLDGDGKRVIHDLKPKHRLELLLDSINESQRGILIFSDFKSVIEKIEDFLKKGEIECRKIHGEVTQNERHEIIKDFQDGKIKVLVLHPRTMAHGVTLTYADTVIWYGVTSDNELYEQANARINRIGQDFKMRVLHFVSTPFEKLVLKKLRLKQSVQGSILEAFGKQKFL